MSITVQETLTLNVLQDAVLIAGHQGLGRVVKRVSVIECPDCEDYKGLLREGDFFLTTFYAVKDDQKSLYETIKILIESGSSALFLLDQYMTDLPAEVKALADQANYPIALISKNLPYADIITEIMDLIIQNKENIITEMQIDRMIHEDTNGETIRKLAFAINPKYKEHVLVGYYTGESGNRKMLSQFQAACSGTESWSTLPYRQGILLLLSFSRSRNKQQLAKELTYLIQLVKGTQEACSLGLSRSYKGLESMGIAIKEAIQAGNLGRQVLLSPVTWYQDLGVYRLLALLHHSPELRAFHDDKLVPILDYDSKNHTNLFKTAEIYIANDGDMSKTAQELFQHVNTIRYRITKIKEILGMEGLEISFYEQLSLAIKIHKMLWPVN